VSTGELSGLWAIRISTTIILLPPSTGTRTSHYALKDQENLAALVATRSFSTSAQSGSLLQYAKAGISLVHHDVFASHDKVYEALAKCPSGRLVGTQPLREVVWQSRNHAMHWEDGVPNKSVQRCFDTLVQDFGTTFAEYRTRNLSFEVIQLLGWNSFEDFQRDMLTLA